MKLLLLHGPAIISSRKKLTDFKNNFDANNTLVLASLTDPLQLYSQLASLSLLPQERLIILENPSDDLSLEKLPEAEVTLVAWLDHELNTKKPLYSFFNKHGQIIFFPEGKETSVFPFLDKLGERKIDAFVEMEKLLKSGYDNQYLFTMILYQLRSLVVPKAKTPKFVQEKLSRQRAKFLKDELVELYRCVLESDYKFKCGLMEEETARFLVVSKFIYFP